MSYAQAAAAGSQTGSDKYSNRNMVVCLANGIEYEALAKVLNEKGYWKDVIGYQRVDFNRKYALVFKNDRTRDLLVDEGLNVNGVHVNFAYHRRKEDARIRVLVFIVIA